MRVQCPNCEQWYDTTQGHICNALKGSRDGRDDTGINASS